MKCFQREVLKSKVTHQAQHQNWLRALTAPITLAPAMTFPFFMREGGLELNLGVKMARAHLQGVMTCLQLQGKRKS